MRHFVNLVCLAVLLNGTCLAAECWKLEMHMSYPSKYGHNDIRWLGKFNVTEQDELVGKGFGEIRHAGPCVKLKGGVSRFDFDIGGAKVDSGDGQDFVFEIEDFENPDTALDPDAPFACVLIGPIEAIGMWLQGGFYPETVSHPAREITGAAGSKGVKIRNRAGVDLIVKVSEQDCSGTLPGSILACEGSEELCCEEDDDACRKLTEAYGRTMDAWQDSPSGVPSER